MNDPFLNDPIRAQSQAVASMSRDWPLIDALMEGTPAMRAGGKRWLPKFTSEHADDYDVRLSVATLHPSFKHTILVNAARPFSRPMTIGEKTPKQVLEWTENIDLQGSSVAAFAVQLMKACLSKGLTGTLVDYPTADGIKSKADEIKAGARPYCIHYDANSILGWRVGKGEKGVQLTQLRLLEYVEEESGEFGTNTIEQVRVLEVGKWRIFRKDEKQKKWVIFKEGTTTLDVIPFVFHYGIRKGYGIGAPPLADLAYQNLEHYQSSSDQQTILHVARVPILFGKNLGTDTKIKIGSSSATLAKGEHADLKYVEHGGEAIESGRQSILDLEDRMRATGAELISQKTAFTTATQISDESEQTKSTLQQIVEMFQETFAQCLNYMAAWVGEGQAATVELYKDYAISLGTDAQILSAVGAKVISKQTGFAELQRRDIIDRSIPWDASKEDGDEPGEFSRLQKESALEADQMEPQQNQS